MPVTFRPAPYVRALLLARALLLVFAAWLPASAVAQEARHVKPALFFETRAPAPGSTVTVAIRMQAEPGWHGYWSNPGEVGLPVEARWRAPSGVAFGDLRHPAPSLLDVQGVASYVHEGSFTLLTSMRVSRNVQIGSALPVQVALNWLVCSDSLCVPETATLSADLIVGDGEADMAGSTIVAGAERSLPRASRDVTVTRTGADWLFSLPQSVGTAARVFPADEGWFVAGAPQTVAREGGRITVRVPAAAEAPRGRFQGVTSGAGTALSFSVRPTLANATGDRPIAAAPDVERQEIPAEDARPVSLADSHEDEEAVPVSGTERSRYSAVVGSSDVIWIALVGALLGGLLLNVMPCVFPILSLKAMALARSGGNSIGARREGLGYAAGAIFTAMLLGGLLIGLRAMGMEIGWSFQLQSPVIILALLVLTSAIGLNLAGLFEVSLPGFAGIGRAKEGWIGGFSTGALASVIGMPCSGPFMAGALGAALVLPAPIALGVFAMLGLGMALPFLAVAFVPGLHRRLPKPGGWMQTLRKVLSIPMFATALGLAWLLGRQTGVDGMALGILVATLVALSLWWFGLRQRGGMTGWPALASAAVVMMAVPWNGLPEDRGSARAEAIGERSGQEPFSEARLAELRAAGTPVFVDFTADWCLVCKVNERVAIDTDAARAAFAQGGVVTLTGDWTRQDPAITRFLTRHGRNSIPFYLFYPVDGPPNVLPQVLTPKILADAADRSRPS